MAIILPTYETLYGSSINAVIFYKTLFDANTLTDDQIKNLHSLAFTKVDPIFGEFRLYTVGEDTVRNEHIKRAVSFEANAIANANADASKIEEGALNDGDGSNQNITSEKIGNITTSYGKGTSGTVGGNGAVISSVLGLLSVDAGVLIARYIRKSYGWGVSVNDTATV